MLGHYLKDIELNGCIPVRELHPGMAVVGIRDVKNLETYGMPESMQFAIVTDNDSLIFQLCIGEEIEKCKFCIQEISTSAFKKQYGKLYSYHMEGTLPAEHVLKQAKNRLANPCDSRMETLRSYTGDDFVDECLLGNEIIDLIQKEPAAGQHWVVPLDINLALIVRQLQGHPAIQRILQNAALNPTVHEGTHHGIALEANQMLHFSTCRTPDGINRLKLDPMAIFNNISHTVKKGTPLYTSDTAEARLRCRNRAIWWLFHSEKWGEYCLFRNNCEHFSRYCREGEKKSEQVLHAALRLIIAAAPLAIPHLRGITFLTPVIVQLMHNNRVRQNNKKARD